MLTIAALAPAMSLSTCQKWDAREMAAQGSSRTCDFFLPCKLQAARSPHSPRSSSLSLSDAQQLCSAQALQRS